MPIRIIGSSASAISAVETQATHHGELFSANALSAARSAGVVRFPLQESKHFA